MQSSAQSGRYLAPNLKPLSRILERSGFWKPLNANMTPLKICFLSTVGFDSFLVSDLVSSARANRLGFLELGIDEAATAAVVVLVSSSSLASSLFSWILVSSLGLEP